MSKWLKFNVFVSIDMINIELFEQAGGFGSGRERLARGCTEQKIMPGSFG